MPLPYCYFIPKTMNRVQQILGTRYPLVQAPMNWINSAEMVAAVSNAGALGVLGPNAGPKEENGQRLPTAERVARVLARINELTDRPYGINIISAPDDATRAYAMKNIKAAAEAGVKVYAVVGTYDEVIYRAIKQAGGIIMHRELDPTPAAAHRAEQGGADIIVATGRDEGGMLPHGQCGTFTIVPQIVDAVSVPVLAAGGINDVRGVRAAFALGAEGVYVGSRFAVATECPAAPAAKEAILKSDGLDMVYVSEIERSLPTAYALELNRLYNSGESTENLEKRIHANGGLRPAMLEGKLDQGIISVNTGIGLIARPSSCADIIAELMADFAK